MTKVWPVTMLAASDSEIERHGRNLLGLNQTGQGLRIGQKCVAIGRVERFVEGRVDVAGTDDVAADAFRRIVEGDGAGQIDDAGFGGGVGRFVAARTDAKRAGDVDEHAAFCLRLQDRNGVLGGQKDAAQIDGHALVPLGFADVGDAPDGADASAADHDVQAAKVGDRRPPPSAPRRFRRSRRRPRSVARPACGSDLFANAVELGPGSTADDNVGAGRGQGQCAGTANA